MAPRTNRSLPRITASGIQFATVIVGPARTKFVVQEALLVHYSEFFRAALTGEFKEGKEKVVTLQDDEPGLFELFVHWLYYQRFPDEAKGDHQELLDLYVDIDGNGALEQERLIDLYILGDQYEVPKLQKDALDELFHRQKDSWPDLPHWSLTAFAFEKLQPSTPLCRWLIDAYCYWMDENTYGDETTDCKLPPSAWAALARRFAWLVHDGQSPGQIQRKYRLDLCDYHEHASEEEKAACKAERGVKDPLDKK